MSVFRARRFGAVLVFALVVALPGVGAAQDPVEYLDHSITVTLDGYLNMRAGEWEWDWGGGGSQRPGWCLVEGTAAPFCEFELAGGYNNQPARVGLLNSTSCFGDRQGARGTGRLTVVDELTGEMRVDVTISDFGWQIGDGHANHSSAVVSGRWTDGGASGGIEGVFTRSLESTVLWPWWCNMRVAGQFRFIPDGLPTEP